MTFCGPDGFEPWLGNNFSSCFLNVIILGIPILYLFLTGIAVLILRLLAKPKSGGYLQLDDTAINELPSLQVIDFGGVGWNRFQISEIIFSSGLAILCIAELISYEADDKFNASTGSDIFILIASAAAWIFTVALLFLARRYEPEGPQIWCLPTFWALMFLANTCKLFSVIQSVAYAGWAVPYTWFIIYYMLLGAQATLGIFFRKPSKEFADAHKLGKDRRATLFSRLTFSWLNPILSLGYKRPLTPEDMWELSEDDKTAAVRQDFEREWKKELILPEGEVSLSRALRRAHGTPFMFAGFFKLVHDLLMFVGPLLLNQLIGFVNNQMYEYDNPPPTWHGYAICLALFVTNIIQTASLHQYFQRCFRTGMLTRSSVIAAVYAKSLVLSISSRQDSTTGGVVNLMSVDAQRFQDLFPYLHMVWSAPMQIGIALALLYQYLGPSIFAGFAFMVVMIPINGFVAKKMKGFQEKQMKIKDKRVKLLNEILNGIKVIKLYAWERSFSEKVSEVRGTELLTLRDAMMVKAFTVFLWTGTPLLVSVITFATFVAGGGELTPQKAFTSISLFNILRFPTNALPMVITNLVEASVSVRRLREFLLMPEINAADVQREEHVSAFAAINHGEFAWRTKKEKDAAAKEKNSKGAEADTVTLSLVDNVDSGEEVEVSTLRDITIEARPGEIVAIIGKVGCGKSTLMQAFLGEVPKKAGTVTVNGSVAYVPQQAWIQNATLRENVTFGTPFNFQKYSRVIEACALEPDIAMLPNGDMTQVGEKGITLSGGQKQRLSLARAVYQNAAVYLFDDPLSAVDAHVGRHIFNEVVGPNGMLNDRVRIFATHAEQYLPECDKIYVMGDGKFILSGTYEELLKSGHVFTDTLAEMAEEQKSSEESPLLLSSSGGQGSSSSVLPSPAGVRNKREHSGSLKLNQKGELVAAEEDEIIVEREREETEGAAFGKSTTTVEVMELLDPDAEAERKSISAKKKQAELASEKAEQVKLIQEEDRQTGKVPWTIYWEYFRSLGRFNAFIIFLSFGIMQGSQIYSQLWLANWTSMSVDDPDYVGTTYYLGIYSALVMISALAVFMRSVALAFGSLRSSKNLHEGMFDTVLHAPMSFFDTTPLGRIINRFSKDQYTIDELLPNVIGMWLGALFTSASIIVVILIPTPIFVVVLVSV